MDILALRREIRRLVEPSVRRLGYDLVAVEWAGGPSGPILRLSIDKTGGVNARDCAKVSSLLSPVLDEEDPISGSYNLEVSSPGINRPVERVEDFRRFEGFRVKLRLVEGHPRRRYTGELRGLIDEDVVVLADGIEHRIAMESIDRAHLVLSLDEYQALAEGPPPLPENLNDLEG